MALTHTDFSSHTCDCHTPKPADAENFAAARLLAVLVLSLDMEDVARQPFSTLCEQLRGGYKYSARFPFPAQAVIEEIHVSRLAGCLWEEDYKALYPLRQQWHTARAYRQDMERRVWQECDDQARTAF